MRIFFLLCIHACASASLLVGVGQREIIPPKGAPSAGYTERKGEGMLGVHDPLYATALFIDNGKKQVAFCSADHLGYTYEMVQAVAERVHQLYPACEIYLGSTHTHSGGGAFLNIPVIGEMMAGPYDSALKAFYIEKAAEAILEAASHPEPACVGIGYGRAEGLSLFRALWPKDVEPSCDLTVIKVVRPDGTPLALLYNYPMHPTILDASNRLFSADFVGFAREKIQNELKPDLPVLYFNGAQGDLVPKIEDQDRYSACASIGGNLADRVVQAWKKIEVEKELSIATEKMPYSFGLHLTPLGIQLPLSHYRSEINLIVLNKHVFVTIPGELSCAYEQRWKERFGRCLTILGLVNDAHGYIILPEAYSLPTYEAAFSFGGRDYGDEVEKMVFLLLERYAEDFRAAR